MTPEPLLPDFLDWLAAKVGTRKWVVADRLAPRLRDKGYERAIPVARYHAWYEAHGAIAAALAHSLEPAILDA